MTLNPLRWRDAMVRGGFAEEAAREVVEVVEETLGDLATKQDLQQVKQEILLEMRGSEVRHLRLYIVGITLLLTAIGVASAALAILL